MSTNDSESRHAVHGSGVRAIYPVLSMLAGATMWGVIWYPMRLLENAGLQGPWLAFSLYGVALLATIPWAPRYAREFTASPGLIAVLGLAAGWTNVAFIVAVLEGNVLRVLLLFYLSPLWAAMLGRIFLSERMSEAALMSLGVAMVGALLMLWNAEMGIPWPESRADWLAISSGFAFAVSNVATRKMEHVSVPAKTLSVWLGVIAVAGTAIVVFSQPMPPITPSIVIGAAALGIGGVILMTAFVQYGVTHMPVHRSAVIALFELVAGALSQQLLTDEVVSLREWIGGALIIFGAYRAARATVH